MNIQLISQGPLLDAPPPASQSQPVRFLIGLGRRKREGGGEEGGCHGYLLEVVNHEEDVGVAHLRLLPFTVHGVFTWRRIHLL